MKPTTLPLCFFLLSFSAPAQMPGPGHPMAPPPPSIQTVGDATVNAQPDRAIIDIAVVNQGQSAAAAASDNARQTDSALREIKRAAGAQAEVKTLGYSLQPDYRYPKQGGRPEIAGYTARNTIEITTSDLGSAGKIIDAATQNGANTVQRLDFVLKNDQAARAEALRLAAQEARASAEAIASALGVRIVRVLRAESGGGVMQPPRPMMMAMAREATPAPPTPVEAGTIEVHANVTLVVEVAQ